MSAPKQNAERVRRKSFTEVSNPERVIRNMKFGFTVDLTPTVTTKDSKNVVEALQSLGNEGNDVNVIELANKAISMERKFISQHREEISEEGDNIDQILDNARRNEALMSYYYIDDDKTVKITELYNVTEADTSVILPDDEREVNRQLTWDKDWIGIGASSSHHRMSITDTFDDTEFVTSDDDTDLRELNDSFTDEKSFQQLCDNFKNEKIENSDSYVKPSPRRKKSFIFVN